MLVFPGINDCVIEYVENIEKNDGRGIMYNIDGIMHLEGKSSNLHSSIDHYKIGSAHGCIMASGSLYSDINNTFSCSVSYLIQKSPMHNNFKKPLGLLKEM